MSLSAKLSMRTPPIASARRPLFPWLAGFIWLGLVWGALLAVPAGAQALVPVPALTARVMDQTGTLPAADVAALEQQLQAFEAERGTQIVVLLVPTTAPEDIADFTQRLGDAWKIGRREVGDGLLLVVAVNDRRLRIAPAKALEGAVPDLAAKRIIDQVISPAFRQGDVAAGLREGLNHVQARIIGEALPLPDATAPPASDDVDWMNLAVLLMVAVPLVGAVFRQMLGNRWGSLTAGGLSGLLAWHLTSWVWLGIITGLVALIMSLFWQMLPTDAVRRASGARGRSGRGGEWPVGAWGSGSHGGWGGSSGGGGFSSGGGGGFGGGGASGGW